MTSHRAAEVAASIINEADVDKPAAAEVKRTVEVDRARRDLQARLGVFRMQLLAAGHASGCALCGSLDFRYNTKWQGRESNTSPQGLELRVLPLGYLDTDKKQSFLDTGKPVRPSRLCFSGVRRLHFSRVFNSLLTGWEMAWRWRQRQEEAKGNGHRGCETAVRRWE